MGFISYLQGLFKPPKKYTALHEAAANSRRLKGWTPTSAEINTILNSNGGELVRRSRQTCMQNPYAISAKESFAAHLIGTGIKATCTLDDEGRRAEVNRVWRAWVDEADADGTSNLYGLMGLVAHALFEAGEIFVRIRRRRTNSGLQVPVQLQCLEAEFLDRTHNEALVNGNQIKCGIEFNKRGQRVAYHFWTDHPGDTITPMRSSRKIRVPAQDVIHVYKVLRPGQLRGMPLIVGGLVRLYLLDQYDDAELDRKKTAAMLAGFITSPEDEGGVLPGVADTEDAGSLLSGDTTVDGIADLEWQPGTLTQLNPGESIEFSKPADVGGTYEVFQYRNLLAIAAAVGVPYVQMTGDVEKANYSNTRAAMLEFRRRISQLQSNTLIFQFCRRVRRVFLETALLSGALRGDVHELMAATKWIAPRWDWVDPLKDRQAEALAVEKGFKARSEVIESEGGDPEEVDHTIAQDKERAEALGLNFSAQPAQGGQPPSDEEESAQPPPQRRQGAA